MLFSKSLVANEICFWVRDCGLLPAPKRNHTRFPKVHRALCLYFLPHLNRRHCPGAYPSRRHTRASSSQSKRLFRHRARPRNGGFRSHRTRHRPELRGHPERCRRPRPRESKLAPPSWRVPGVAFNTPRLLNHGSIPSLIVGQPHRLPGRRSACPTNLSRTRSIVRILRRQRGRPVNERELLRRNGASR